MNEGETSVKKVLSCLISICILLQLICIPEVQAYASTTTGQGNSINNTNKVAQIEDIIKGYYTASYDMWWNLKMDGLSEYLDMDSVQCQNKVTALTESIQKWKYMFDNSYYQGKRERHEIYFDFHSVKINGDNATVDVVLSGETEGTPAYPMFVNFGSNIFNLHKVKGNWLIFNHDYEDVTLYEVSKTKKMGNDFDKDKVQLEKQFKNNKNDAQEIKLQVVSPDDPDYYCYYYSAARAVDYAKAFVTNHNSTFYSAKSDCTNFVSQCLSYGFGNTSYTSYTDSRSFRMVQGSSYTDGWYGHGNGGSQAWEQVSAFYNYVTNMGERNGPRCFTTSTFQNGFIIQMDWDRNGAFDHSAICVDAANQKFAQHSNDGYRYYTDYNATFRFLNPSSFRIYY